MKSRAWILSLLLLAACGEPPVNYVQKVHWQPLEEAELYDKNRAYDVAFDAEEQELDSLRVLSSQLFLQGAEALKNKNQPTEAVRLLKESILALPSARSYYELGNALMMTPKGQGEALKAYEVAEHLQFQPQTNLYYNMALAHAGLANKKQYDSHYQVQYYLQQAIQKGYADTVQLYREPRFREAIQSEYFRDFMLRRKIEQLGDKPDAMFSLYRKSFPLALQPYEIPLEKVDLKERTRSISYDFARFIPEMQNASFGRDVSHEFFYVARVAETSSYTALLYSSVGFMDEDMQPVLTKLVTYNNQGKQISSLVFSCQCSAEKVKKGRIDNNLITLEEYKRVWKHPIHKVSFEENSVLRHELLATATFRIDDKGNILEESVPEEYKDANLIASQK